MDYKLRNNTDFSLIDMLLEDQQRLDTPVAKFSLKHGTQDRQNGNGFHSDLIPLSKPKPGEQYAFQVDLDKCTGCKACVTACHNMNGLDVKESWRDAGKIIRKENNGISYQQTITTACHHCQDPACLNGCPVLAYEKDPLTGIVRHLDDQCIGCQYCVLKCPYDVPKFNKKLGIVRKCDMCYHRLSENEAPACVQACPNKAIKIISVSAYAIQLQSEAPFLPGAPMPGYTKPATQYISERKLPEDLIAADLYRLKKQDPHLPLVFMLLLTQLSIGFYAGGMLIHLFIPQMFSPLTITVITLVGTLAGIALGTLHLGKPLKAWKAFLGFRTSWMSREILAFAGLIQISSLLVVLYLVPAWSIPDMIYTFLHVLLLILCVVAFFSSVKLYEDTKRKLWNLRYTGFKFATSVMILGSIAIWTCASLQIRGQDGARPFLLIFPLSALIVKILLEMRFLNRAGEKDFGPEKKSALTALRILKPVVFVRITTAAIVSLILLFGLVSQTGTGSTTIDTIIAPIALVMVFASEFCERYLYFTTVDAPKMPGEM